MELLPGVLELLQRLQARKDVAVGLVTGNLEPIGWAKMEALGIKGLFSQPLFGGFGTDHCSGDTVEMWRDRADFIRIANGKVPGAPVRRALTRECTGRGALNLAAYRVLDA